MIIVPKRCIALMLLASTFAGPAAIAQPIATQFTYQGELKELGQPVDGTHDLRFRLYDGAGIQLGATFCSDDVVVTAGRFTVALDFGAQFGGGGRLLEIDVRRDAGTDCADPTGYNTLTPRQHIQATPYALTANDAITLGGQPATFFTNASNLSSGTINDTRLSANLPRINQPNSFSGTITAPSFSGSGASLTGLNAGAISSGLLSPARGGTGANTSSAAVGQVLKWNGAAWAPGADTDTTYTAGTNLSLSGTEFRLGYPISFSGTSDAQSLYALNFGTGHGIIGVVTAATTSAGVFGLSTASGGIGVIGEANSGTSPTGLLGRSTNSTGRGVFGSATGASGVGVAASASGATGAAVLATGTGGAFAGRFEGNVAVTGTLRYSTPRERWLAISPIEMAGQEVATGALTITQTTGFASFQLRMASGSGVSRSMQGFSLNLPHGATIGAAQLSYSTTNTTYWPIVRILRHNRLNSTTDVIGIVSGQFSGSGNRTLSAPGTAFAVVDNQNYSYSVTIEGDASSSGGDIQLYGIHVQYFVSDALP